MRRRAFDAVVSWVGVVVTAALLVAGALMLAGSLFATNNVHNELAAQQIFFPAVGSPALASSEIGQFLNRYAGQRLVNGAQAKAWADHFIAVHTVYLEKVAARLSLGSTQPTWEVVESDHPARAICQAAGSLPGAVVAIATRSNAGLGLLALGSVAMQVAHDSPAPVLVVRASAGQDAVVAGNSNGARGA